MKWYGYLICIVLIVSGLFCGIGLFKELNSESYVNGSLTAKNEFSQESFSYSTTSFAMYQDGNNFVFEIDLIPVVDFNGIENNYYVYINNYKLFDIEIGAGSIIGNMLIDFYDTNNNLLCESLLKVNINFYSHKTNLKMVVDDVIESEFITNYFTNNGLRVKVIKGV